MTINLTTVAACQFTFEPVLISRGRKFRGPAFDLGGGYTSRFGYAGSGVCPLQITEKTKLWDPAAKRIVYINADYLEERKLTDTELAEAKLQYVSDVIKSTTDWCKSVKPNLPEAELLQFIRNVLKKQHAELLPVIEDSIPDGRDVVAEVQKTLQWAMTLKTQACWMYGRYCAGGKPLSDKRKVEIAFKALQKKGITKLAGFEEVWQMSCDVMGLKC